MARWAMSLFVGLLTLCSLSTLTKAACSSGAGVIQMCQSGTISGSVLYIDATTTIQDTDRCSCTATLSSEGQVDIYAITGSVFSSCAIRVDVFRQMPSTVSNIYSVHCLQDQGYTGSVPANTDVMYNLNGPGTIDACLMMRTDTTGSTITISCSPKIQNATTPSPTTQAPTTPVPSTQASTTQAPSTQGPTTQAPSTQGPTTQAPSTQSPTTQTPSTQGPTTQAPSTQGPTTQAPSTQGPTTQAPSTQAPTTQAPSTQGPTTQAPSTQAPTTQAPNTQGPTTQGSTVSTMTPLPPTAGSLYDKFPVPEVAGGVAAGIVVIILLIIIITCCTSRNRTEKSDEEMLRGRESPDTEMTEKQDGDGYAFDNILYHATNSTGKSVTPTVSDADTQDYQATKGLEELYASVNKTITDSTDIM